MMGKAVNIEKAMKTSIDTKTYLALTADARRLYDRLTDYLLSTSDPTFESLCAYRALIANLQDSDSKNYLIEFFNNDPLINYPLIPSDPWTHYTTGAMQHCN